MSGRELDPDGTDSCHPEHPWEQVGHALYVGPAERTRGNWPPAQAVAAGAHEAEQWRQLPGEPVMTDATELEAERTEWAESCSRERTRAEAAEAQVAAAREVLNSCPHLCSHALAARSILSAGSL